MISSINPKYKILVVDDDLDVNTTFALLLEYDGHQVQTVSTGEAALAMLARSQYDLVIMEYWLPWMTGDQLAALVRQKWPDLPIILVMTNIEELNMDAHPILGVDCLLDKPFSINQLREAIKWVLEHDSKDQPEASEPHEPHWFHTSRAETPATSRDNPKIDRPN